jgi:hypothetical protein
MTEESVSGPNAGLSRELVRARSRDWRTRLASARSLAGHIEDDAAFHELVRLLSDDDTAVVEEVAGILVELGGEKGLARVLTVLADGPDDIGYHLRDKLVSLWLDGTDIQELSERILRQGGSASARAGAAEILQVFSEGKPEVEG